MLYSKLIHPPIIKALAAAGHGSKILIADGNYPLATHSNPRAEHIFLNLRPGLVSVTDILETIQTAIPIEAAHVMQPNDGSEPTIFTDFRTLLSSIELQPLERFAFYDFARQFDVALAIASGDQRLYANIMLTIGVVQPV
ncbi:MAG: RbsD/FucU family protein [Chloroflexi bacterium]|nr:RbsD/FucU family protein [Chloroflexota bacterium]